MWTEKLRLRASAPSPLPCEVEQGGLWVRSWGSPVWSSCPPLPVPSDPKWNGLTLLGTGLEVLFR